MINRIKLKCQNCGKKFEVYFCRRNAKFCSLECRYKSMIGNHIKQITRIKKQCPLCNKIFEVKKSHKDKRKFCSLECYNKTRMKNAEIKICPICGKKFRVKASERLIRHYCSLKCCYNARKGTNFHTLILKIKQKCLECGTVFEVFPCKIKQNKAKYCSKQCYSLSLRQIMLGKNNPSWKNGLSFEPYSSEFNEELKKEVKIKNNYICQICGITEIQHIKLKNRKLSIHHIDYNKKNCSLDNLITLCSACHSKTSHNREYWKQYFQNNIQINNNLSLCQL
jgi:endogenous inhibitor of DNA gyrase (YacG/DUF329 family)